MLVYFLICALLSNVIGFYFGCKLGFFKGRLEGRADVFIHSALVLHKVAKEVDTVTNGPYVINRVLNIMGIEEIYNLADKEVIKEDKKV